MAHTADKLITVKQVAEMTGLAVRTIYQREAGTDELQRIKVGRLLRFSYQDVCEWIEKKKTEALKPDNILSFDGRALSRGQITSISNRFRKKKEL